MKPQTSRPELDDNQIVRCYEIVDDLIRLYKETDPAHGSEDYKTEKAYQAINKIGMLSAILTEWAEAHIIGCYYNVAKSQDKWIDAAASNSHKNELMVYGELLDNIFEDDESIACHRTALSVMLRNTFRRSGIMGWRMILSESLQALNDGQVEWLLAPTKMKVQGNAYELSNLKWAAIKHVYRLIGEGWKKTAAQQKVAESCGTTFEAIKKWEKQGIRERDKTKISLEGIKQGAAAITLFKKEDDYDEKELLLVAMNMCISNELSSEEQIKRKDFFCLITCCFRLIEETPLETLKDKLIEAGMRISK